MNTLNFDRILLIAITLFVPAQLLAASASDQFDALQSKVERLETQLEAMQQETKEGADAVVHLSGYAVAGYTNRRQEGGGFNQLNFNPIFHYQYRDILLFESELEFEIGEDGETETKLEYATIDWLFSDYAALVAGKFQSPLGQFRQNLHPAWINKFGSAPPGFGHEGAAPTAEVGVQLRGGYKTRGNTRFNYAAYLGNGPQLELNSGGDEIEAVETEGFTVNEDKKLAYGGRVAILPIHNVELGLSVATSRVGLEDEALRSYSVVGTDFWWQLAQFELRGEYIRQEVGSEPGSVAPEGQEWETWYMQTAYKPKAVPFEFVARHTDFVSTHADQSQEQWGIGLNYLITSNAILKFGYEFNQGLAGTPNDSDRFLTQIAYGF